MLFLFKKKSNELYKFITDGSLSKKACQKKFVVVARTPVHQVCRIKTMILTDTYQ